VTVRKDDEEILTHALNDAMDKIEKQGTVFSSEMFVDEASEPENAKEIAAPAV
jgi:ABC-type amino acid transport substrate-binding protein